MHLAEIREHGRACGIENGPLIRIRKRWNRDILAPVEADEGGIHQLVNFHHCGQLGYILARALPNLRLRCSGQHGLDIDAFGRELGLKSLAQEEYEGFGGAIDRGAVFRANASTEPILINILGVPFERMARGNPFRRSKVRFTSGNAEGMR